MEPARNEWVTPIPHGTTNNSPFNFVQEGYTSRSEYLEDDHETRAKWKHCTHTYVYTTALRSSLKFASGVSPYSQWWEWTTSIPTYFWNSTPFGPWTKPLVGLPELFVTSQGKDIAILPPKLEEYVADSLQAMLPRIRPRLSVLNTIAEMRDVKSLPRTVIRIKDTLKKIGSFLKTDLLSVPRSGATFRDLIRQTARTGSDVYLQEQFNIKPLLSDIAGLKAAYDSVDDEIKRLLDNEGKPRLSRYARPLGDVYVPSSVVQGPYTVSLLYGSQKLQRSVTYPRLPMFRAQMEYSYTLTSYQRANATLLGRLDSIGAGGFRPSVIWNAIPWSFVVDWFVDVSRWIKHNLDTGALDPVTVLTRYLFSVDVEREILLSQSVTEPPAPWQLGMVPCVSRCEGVYHRRPYIPDIYSSIRTSGLSLKEFMLAGALATTRVA